MGAMPDHVNGPSRSRIRGTARANPQYSLTGDTIMVAVARQNRCPASEDGAGAGVALVKSLSAELVAIRTSRGRPARRP